MIDLSQHTSLQSNLFVRLEVPDSDVLTFSDHHKTVTINNEQYVPLGNLVNVSSTTDELRAAPSEVTVTISMINNTAVAEVANLALKGSLCSIYRGFFDANTGVLLPITGNPAGKFNGVVSNFELLDELEMGASTGSYTMLLVITSVFDILNNKYNSRRTNPADFENKLMDRVPALAKSNFNFGAPQ